MRDILFRGKSIERETNKDGRRGEWVYGGIEITRRSQPETVWIAVDEDYWYDGPLCEAFEVDSETVGQYTGMTDKNGTMIFEGDVCRNGDRGRKRYEIVCSDGCFYAKIRESDNCVRYCLITRELLVIGNIHDNPEPVEADVE